MAETEKPFPTIEAGAVYDPTLDLTAGIVSAYLAKNPTPIERVSELIFAVSSALKVAAVMDVPAPDGVATYGAPEAEKVTDAQIKKSITPDALISFIDGKPYKTLKRHLTTHGHNPESYRLRFGLPADYPMVASNYAARRSELSKSIGLGRPGGPAAPETAAAPDTSLAA